MSSGWRSPHRRSGALHAYQADECEISEDEEPSLGSFDRIVNQEHSYRLLFPKRFPLAEKIARWRRSDVNDWLADLVGWAQVIAAYRGHEAFLDLAPRTRSDYQAVFDYLKPIADTPLVRFDKPLVVRIRDKAAKDNWLQVRQ